METNPRLLIAGLVIVTSHPLLAETPVTTTIPRLLAAHQARERTRLAALKSPPPRPKNLVLHHWNIGKSTPAPVTQGGAQ